MSDAIAAGSQFGTFEKQDKILVALSGGVDSSVTLQILRDQGFDVSAVVIRFSPAHDKAVEAAKEVAQQLNVPLTVADCTDLFEESVIEPFCQSYCDGETPSPCVMCNPLVKFRALCEAADEMGIELIATGHYARVEERDGMYYVAKAVSEARDQSYMLYRLPQEVLRRLCLPLGEFHKEDIRDMARDLGLASAETPDSQEICFIPDGDYAAFIQARGIADKQGRFVGPCGEDLGAHKGVSHYTVGQRKGLGIAYGEPVFVKRIEASGNILLAKSGDEFFHGVVLSDVFRTDGTPFAPNERFEIKIRSRAVPAPCQVIGMEQSMLTVAFAEPLRAPAPGQSAVFYDGDLVIGGGVIREILEELSTE